MVRPLLQSHLMQPARRLGFDLLPGSPSHEQRHGNILRGRELRQKIVELPYKARFAVAKVCGFVVGQRVHSQVGAVYVTCRSVIKSAQDVQQGTFPRARLAHNGQHLSSLHLKRQILKEHEVRFAGPENLLQALHSKH